MLIKTNNTMKGFLQRLEVNFRRYSFAIWGVFGTVPDLEIRGAWLWRGTDIPEEMKEHPSSEYHKFIKLNPDSAEDRKLFEDYFLNQVEDESVVGGLTVRTETYYR